MQRLPGNVACLVRVADDAPNYTWTLRGRPVPPAQTWTTSGMNFIGFPTPRDNPPMAGVFLGPSRSLHNQAEFYRYVGGPPGETNPVRLWPAILRNTPLNRSEAFWVRAEEFNRYFGPVDVNLQSPAGIRFGTSGGQYRIRVRNTIDEAVVISGRLVASEPSPPRERPIAGEVPLLLRGKLDLTELTPGFTRFEDGPVEWTLQPRGQPGSEVEVMLGLDRAAMTGDPGDLFAGILRLSDAGGLVEIDLLVSAEVASTTGLWVGNALVGEVQHNLV